VFKGLTLHVILSLKTLNCPSFHEDMKIEASDVDLLTQSSSKIVLAFKEPISLDFHLSQTGIVVLSKAACGVFVLVNSKGDTNE